MGQAPRSAVRNASPILAEEHKSGSSSIPEADQLPPDHADHLQDIPQQQEAVSPVSRLALRWHTENLLQQYIKGIRLSPHRWVLVGDNINGASLYAVAGYDRGSSGDIRIMVSGKSLISLASMQEDPDLMLQLKGCLNLMQVSKSMHVLVIPMIHPDSERHYFYLCSCMTSGMHILGGMSSAVTPKAGISSRSPRTSACCRMHEDFLVLCALNG